MLNFWTGKAAIAITESLGDFKAMAGELVLVVLLEALSVGGGDRPVKVVCQGLRLWAAAVGSGRSPDGLRVAAGDGRSRPQGVLSGDRYVEQEGFVVLLRVAGRWPASRSQVRRPRRRIKTLMYSPGRLVGWGRLQVLTSVKPQRWSWFWVMAMPRWEPIRRRRMIS